MVVHSECGATGVEVPRPTAAMCPPPGSSACRLGMLKECCTGDAQVLCCVVAVHRGATCCIQAQGRPGVPLAAAQRLEGETTSASGQQRQLNATVSAARGSTAQRQRQCGSVRVSAVGASVHTCCRLGLSLLPWGLALLHHTGRCVDMQECCHLVCVAAGVAHCQPHQLPICAGAVQGAVCQRHCPVLVSSAQLHSAPLGGPAWPCSSSSSMQHRSLHML